MPSAGADDVMCFGDFELRPAERALRVHGEPVALGGRAFDLLLVLAQRHERVVSKQELLDLVWPGLVVEEHNIATQIGTLRKWLGASAVTTIPGRGYRLTAPLVAAPIPAPVSPALRPSRHNLPDPRTRFIGREAALADLARLLPSTRLLTLVGIGGCGKTRLALQLAQQQRAAFSDGVWFVDLAPLQDAQRVPAACAGVLGLSDDGDAPLLERVAAHLAVRQALLVLDNCEHVLAGVVALVEALLAGGGATTIVATSREGLGVSGEQSYPVRSLSLPATGELQAVLEAESVRVFVDRARLVLPAFEVDAHNAAHAAEICRRLDGIALAIELAAARVTMLSVAEIAERLDDRFRLLTGGSRVLPRHRTLEAVMQWSYWLLTPPEQRLLRQVAVFAGGWTLQSAADVAQTTDEYEALALLTGLHDKSLLVVELDATQVNVASPPVSALSGGGLGAARTSGHSPGRPRYRMLDTVRHYALERLNECGEADAVRGRHVAHFVAMAEEAEQQVRGSEQDVWIGWFRQEHENLIAAVTWCCEGPVDPQSGLRLAAAASYYWGWNCVELGHRLARAALDHDHAAADTPAREAALRGLARLSLFRGRYEESLARAQQALAAARHVGAQRPLALALDAVGTALETLARVEEALPYQEEAVDLARKLGDSALIFHLLNNIASSRRSTGQLDAAERCFREALELSRTHAGRLGRVIVLDNLIRVLVTKGQADEARRFAIECLPLARHERVGVDLLGAVIGLASCLGEHEMAARLWGAWDQKLREWGYREEPVDLEHTAPFVTRSREALGDAAFEAAEAAGRALDFEGAMLALQHWLERTGHALP